MEWYSIVIDLALSLFLVGVSLLTAIISSYVRVKGLALHNITEVEKLEKEGIEKMALVIDNILKDVNPLLRLYFTKERVRKIVQNIFDKVEEYAIMQVEKKVK